MSASEALYQKLSIEKKIKLLQQDNCRESESEVEITTKVESTPFLGAAFLIKKNQKIKQITKS